MRCFNPRRTAIVTITLLAALAVTHRADANGVVNIDACQTLSIPNTTYKLTADLTSSDDCLIVAANKITIDMQGHRITGAGQIPSRAIGDDANLPLDVLVIKNGTVSGYGDGIGLHTRRVSVIAVTATHNVAAGIALFGDQSLVKASTASFNGGGGIVMLGNRAQVQQSTANNNAVGGIHMGPNCLVTMSTANANGPDLPDGIRTSNRCTVSYNTANDNGGRGIVTFGTPNLVTHNTAVNNGDHDFAADCPSDVTFNTSTTGFPVSYLLNGVGCRAVGNN